MRAHGFVYLAGVALALLPSMRSTKASAHRVDAPNSRGQSITEKLAPIQTNELAQNENEDNSPGPEYCYAGSIIDSVTGETVDLYTLCDDFERA